MMLDVKSEVFLWVGNFSRKEERDLSMKVAQQYIQSAPDGRSAECPIIEVREANEPWIFTRHFHGWRAKKQFADPYEKNVERLRQLGLIGKVCN